MVSFANQQPDSDLQIWSAEAEVRGPCRWVWCPEPVGRQIGDFFDCG